MKAIVITDKNIEYLAGRYGVEDPEGLLVPGFILISTFGTQNHEEYIEGVLNQTGFDLLFNKGEDLLNGFFAISRK